MKIGFVSTFFTGATLPFCQHLHERGHSVDFFLFARQGQGGLETFVFDKPVAGSQIQDIEKKNPIYGYLDTDVNISIVPYYIVRNRKYLVGFWNYFKNLLILHRLCKKIVQGAYDLIYIIVNEELDYLIYDKLRRKGFRNIVVAYHEVLTNHTSRPQLKSVVRKSISHGLPVIVYSKHTQRVLFELTGYDNIHTIYFGPFETYRLYESQKPIMQEDYILFIGSIQPYKGLSFFCETIEKYKENIPYKIVVAGSGKDKSLESIRNDAKYVLLNRFLTDSEFANLVKFAKGIVCPYKAGSQSGITQTAMVFGTPVIATRAGAFPEFIDEGKNGLLVDYGNQEQLFSAIQRLCCVASSFGEFVPKHLRWDDIVNNFEKLPFVKKEDSNE